MTDCYTVVSFAPVQGFIEKSRKLRDLFGSSYILSYLAHQICQAARLHFIPDRVNDKNLTWPDDPVISPARVNLAQGTPNQIVIRGLFPKEEAQASFNQTWHHIIMACREWIEDAVPHKTDGTAWEYTWKREWKDWSHHAWEFFWVTGDSIDSAFVALNEIKRSRAWTGVNWTGESSTLSGADARAWPGMALANPKTRNASQEDNWVETFYLQLSEAASASIITPREQLSIPELVKRLITHTDIADKLYAIETPSTFRGLSRWQDDETADEDRESDRQEAGRWTGWFQGDGDKAGDYLKAGSEATRYRFSRNMRQWGLDLKNHLPKANQLREVTDADSGNTLRTLDADGRIIYAGGDDFLGVLYRNRPHLPLTAIECLRWFYRFKSDIWNHGEPITPSVGFVWAGHQVPQREILQQCYQAERAAKEGGRDRLAIRIVFNSGNRLQWICPWWFLESVIEGYRDRDGVYQGDASQSRKAPNWTHLYNDVAVLASRHAFRGQTDVALGLFELYFGDENRALLEQHLWDRKDDERTGILGNTPVDDPDPSTAQMPDKLLNDWIVSLAEVGFHLCAKQSEAVGFIDDGEGGEEEAIAA